MVVMVMVVVVSMYFLFRAHDQSHDRVDEYAEQDYGDRHHCFHIGGNLLGRAPTIQSVVFHVPHGNADRVGAFERL